MDIFSLLIVVVSAVVGVIRFFVPGHPISGAGSIMALLTIAVGASLAWGCWAPRSSRRAAEKPLAVIFAIAAIVVTIVIHPTWPYAYEVLAHVWVGALLFWAGRAIAELRSNATPVYDMFVDVYRLLSTAGSLLVLIGIELSMFFAFKRNSA